MPLTAEQERQIQDAAIQEYGQERLNGAGPHAAEIKATKARNEERARQESTSHAGVPSMSHDAKSVPWH